MTAAASFSAWLAVSGFVLGLVGVASHALGTAPRLAATARGLAWIWAAAVWVAWGLRTATVGHLPLFGTYESALSLAAATVTTACLWEALGRGRVPLALPAVVIASAVLGHGSRFDPTPYALTISERSLVVDAHAVLAWAAFAVLAVTALVALSLLVPRQAERATSERWLGRSLQVGFLLHTGMMVSGSIYKFMLFGRAWSFDPMETMGLATWLVYGTLLHLASLARWSPRRLAGWCLAAFALLVVSYRAIVYFPPWSTYHILDMDRRLHVVAPAGGER